MLLSKLLIGQQAPVLRGYIIINSLRLDKIILNTVDFHGFTFFLTRKENVLHRHNYSTCR